MKICVLTSSFPRFKGDMSGIFLYHLSKSLIDKGIQIEVICPHEHGYPKFEIMDGIRINRFSYFKPEKYQCLAYGSGVLKNLKTNLLLNFQIPFFILFGFMYTFWKIIKIKPDLIHAHWILPQGLTGIICKRLLKKPCVTTMHGSDVHGLNHPWIIKVKSKVIKLSDKCTANSQATKKKASQILSRSDIEIIPMGVNTDEFKRADNLKELKNKYGQDKKIILYVGRFIDLKGVEYLIKAVPLVIKKFNNLNLLLIGSGPSENEYQKIVMKYNLAEHIYFIDTIPQEKLIKYYSIADALILPSIVNDKGETEGLGVVLLEALACGCPVIGTNAGGIKEVILDKKTGLLAEQKDPGSLAEKINTLLSDDQIRKKIIENGFQLIQKKFSWNVVSEKFIKIYNDAIKNDII